MGNGSDDHVRPLEGGGATKSLGVGGESLSRAGAAAAAAVAAVVEKPPSRRFALTPDVVLHVEEAIETVVQRARDGPLEMPVNKHAPPAAALAMAAKHARPAAVAVSRVPCCLCPLFP